MLLAAASCLAFADAGSAASSSPKSAKRGVAYDLSTKQDLSVLAPGVSWWYD